MVEQSKSLENVDKALQFLYEQKVHLENLGAHDIVDGSSRLTLGLIWTIILRFQVVYLNLSLKFYFFVLFLVKDCFDFLNQSLLAMSAKITMSYTP
jgi:hypothetical protein